MLIDLLKFFAATYEREFNFKSGPPLHDPLAVAFVAMPESFTTTNVRVDIETTSPLCAGQTVVDFWSQTGRSPNVTLATAVKVDKFWQLMCSAWKTANENSPLT